MKSLNGICTPILMLLDLSFSNPYLSSSSPPLVKDKVISIAHSEWKVNREKILRNQLRYFQIRIWNLILNFHYELMVRRSIQ